MRSSHIAICSIALALPLAALPLRAQTPAPAVAPAAAGPAPVAAPVEDPRVRFTGTFHYAGGDGQRATLTAAIERAVADRTFITRGIARDRLTNKNPVYSNVGFQFPAGMIDCAMSGRPTIHTRDDGTAGQTTSITGDPLRVTQRLENGHIVQVLSSDEGTRRNEFVASADGHSLTMRVTVTSGQLPAPLRYELSYRK